MPRKALDAAVWAATLLGVLVGGLLASIFVVMPTSLGPSELIEAGTEPWLTALYAGLSFLGLVASAVLGLILWHTRRARLIGAVIVVAELVCVAWACWKVYTDYF